MKRRQAVRFAWRAFLEHLEPRVLFTALPTVNFGAVKSATELNSFTTGAGKFTLTRSGPTTGPLTVDYAIDVTSTAVNGVDYNTASMLTGVVVFDAGSASATIVINPIDTGLADGPKKVTLDLIAGGTTSAYNMGTHRKATLTIADHAPTITLSATKPNASEINGSTSGAGVFTFRRTGSTSTALTVDFAVGGNATEGADYTMLPLHSVNFSAGQTSATVTIHPIDDLLTEGREKVTLTIAADATPASYHFRPLAATVTIADDTRPIFMGTVTPLAGAIKNTAFNISYNDLLAATGVRDHAGKPITFKVTAIKVGTLQRNGIAAVAGKSTVTSTDTLTWSPPTGFTGTVAAFSVSASDGSHSTGAVTLSIIVTAGAGVIAHPTVMQVMPAALDQPQINAIVYVGNNTAPQVGQTTTLDPDTLESVNVSTFNVTGYLDTGASSILISNPTNSVENIPLATSGGQPVIYSDVGVAGSDNFQVSQSIRLSLASSYQRTDLDQFSDAAQTIPITAPYTPIPAPNDNLRVEVGPFVPTVDNPITDDFSSLIDDLSAVDVIGMPAMVGRVTVIDPTHVNNFGSVLDALLADPDNFDLSALDADMSVHAFIYAPGTPFHPLTPNTDPGIPTTDLHVKLSYASFDRFTSVTPDGQPGPTLIHNPIIGEDPVSLLDGTPQPANPGIKITRDITSGGATQTLTSEGNWLLDTGAAASIISKAQAAKLDVSYQDGTFGTDNPVLVDQDGNPLPDQFTLGIGGIGGQETLAGFYLDSLTVRTQEGSASDDANPNNLHYTHEPVLVGDVTVKDPANGQTLTLDGIFGMNNLIASADFSLDAEGNIGDFNASTGYFNWITFDEPNGLLGLSYDPAALAAAPAGAHSAAAITPAVTPAALAPIATTPTSTPTVATSIFSSSIATPVTTDPITTTPTLISPAPSAPGDTLTTTILTAPTSAAATLSALAPNTPSTGDPIILALAPSTMQTATPLQSAFHQ